MDFARTDEQQAMADLTARILGDRLTLDRLAEVEAGDEWFDREVWADLARADLLGLALPEAVGGGGYGFLEACLLLEEVGRTVAPVPLWSTSVAALAIARFADDASVGRLLPAVAAGDSVLALALSETDGDLLAPSTRASATSDGWALSGAKTGVGALHVADVVLVPASVGDDTAVFVVPPGPLRGERQDTFNHEPQFRVELDGIEVPPESRLGGDRPGEVLPWLVDRATVALCAVAAGVADRGLRLTADYASEREQFDRKIATFQAVGQRLADAFVDAEAIRLTMLQAAARLDRDDDATAEVAIAKYWASVGGSRVGHAGLHVHGGISIDLDYPIHRHFLWAKQIEFQLGSGTEQLARLGSLLTVGRDRASREQVLN